MPAMVMDKEDLDRLATLKNGEGLRFRVPDPDISAFIIKYEDRLHAYENRCPHLGTELDWEPGQFFNDEQALLVCSTHGACFKPDTGKCVSGPCAGQSLVRLNGLDQQE